MDKIKLAQRTIALLSSMIESGECHTARTKEMKTNALNGLEEVNNLLISGVSISFFAKLFKPHLIWDWYDFGLVLKISKQNNIGNYHFAIDVQIAWLNLWVQCWQKH